MRFFPMCMLMLIAGTMTYMFTIFACCTIVYLELTTVMLKFALSSQRLGVTCTGTSGNIAPYSLSFPMSTLPSFAISAQSL